MANTIYASFDDVLMAEKAAGALLDHGVRSDHISLVRRHFPDEGVPASGATSQTDGIIVGGPGTLQATGSGIQPGTGSSADIPASAGSGRTPSPGYDEAEVDSTAHAQGFVSEEDIDEREGHLTSLYEAPEPIIPPPVVTSSIGGVAPLGLGGEPGMSYDMPSVPEEPEEIAKYGLSTTTPADAGAGAIKGSGVGLGVGVIAALASIFVPGFGIVVGGGALAIVIAGIAATMGAGAVTGAVFGYLKDQGMDEPAARRFTDTIHEGGALIAVQYPSGWVEEDEIRQILAKYGAANVGSVGPRSYMA